MQPVKLWIVRAPENLQKLYDATPYKLSANESRYSCRKFTAQPKILMTANLAPTSANMQLVDAITQWL